MRTRKGCLVVGICMGIMIYLILVVLYLFHVPMSLFLRMLPPLVIVGLLLRHTPKWVKAVVGVLLVVGGVSVLFNNDIKGPMEFAISDRPFDMPAQFYHSWRYFWCMAYLYDVSWTWGVPSAVFLLGYKGWQHFAH